MNGMNGPDYILKTFEAEVFPDPKVRMFRRVGIAALAAAVILFIAAYALGRSWAVKAPLLIAAAVLIFVIRWYEKVHAAAVEPSPVEIRFYDTYMIFHFLKRSSEGRRLREEVYRVGYGDVKEILWDTERQNFFLDAPVEKTVYGLDQDGEKAELAARKETVGFLSFSTQFADCDIAREIEAHSPLKVAAEQ